MFKLFIIADISPKGSFLHLKLCLLLSLVRNTLLI